MMPSAAAATITSSRSTSRAAMPELPAGFRFHPTDEELVVHYLANQSTGTPCPAPVIAEANIYACDPWELIIIPATASRARRFAAEERYFFSPRDRKYPNGAWPNRAVGGGYWKDTGTDRPVVSSSATTSERVGGGGVKKALVFYSGRPPRGVKTDWIMHEYRLVTDAASSGKSSATTGKRSSRGSSSSSSMRLDDWVLCRIYKKSNHLISDQLEQEQEEASSTIEGNSFLAAKNNMNTAALASSSSPKSETLGHDGHQFHQSQTLTMGKSCSLTDLLNAIYCAALSQICSC